MTKILGSTVVKSRTTCTSPILFLPLFCRHKQVTIAWVIKIKISWTFLFLHPIFFFGGYRYLARVVALLGKPIQQELPKKHDWNG